MHLALRDASVGPRSIVAWRHRKGSRHKGGGGHQFYTGAERDGTDPLPTIVNGMDVRALVSVLMPQFMKMRPGEPPPEFTPDDINAELAKLPDKPDETLR